MVKLSASLSELTRLITVRNYTFKQIKWFILSILVITSLFTITTSFLLGFSFQEVFVGQSSSDNTLIISEPNAYTPSQSHIPLYWASDIIELNGILTTSPETVDIVVDKSHNKPVFYRGVSQEYSKIEPGFQFIDGLWFNNASDTITLNEIIVGSEYAKLMEISVGEHLILNSRPHPIMLEVIVVGIFKTDTIADEGILGPMWMGRLFAGLDSDLVNIIRIKFDPSIYDKQNLVDIILGEHELKIVLLDKTDTGIDLSQTKIDLFSRNKELINSTDIGISESIEYSLPFGKYFIRGNHPNVPYKPFTPYYLKENSVYNLEIGQKTFYGNFSFFVSHIAVKNAEIQFLNLETKEMFEKQTDKQGLIFSGVAEGSTKITLILGDYINSTIILVTQNITKAINFIFIAQIQVLNASNHVPLSDVQISLYDKNGFQTILFGLTNEFGDFDFIIHPNTPYIIEVSKNNLFRSLNISYFNSSKFQIFIGFVNISVQIKTYENRIFINQSVTLIDKTVNTTFLSNETGWITITTFVGNVLLLLSRDNESNEWYYFSILITQSFNTIFYLGSQKYYIKILDENKSKIEATIRNLNTGVIYSPEFNNTGFATLNLPYGSYSFTFSNTTSSIIFPIEFFNSLNNFMEISFEPSLIALNIIYSNGSEFDRQLTIFYNNNSEWDQILLINQSINEILLPYGEYRIFSNSTNYLLDQNFLVNSKFQNLTITVLEKRPIITVKGIFDPRYVTLNTQINVSVRNSVNSLYNWDGIENKSFIDNDLIDILNLTIGIHTLSLFAENSENQSYFLSMNLTIINSSIQLMLNNSINNTWVSSEFVPIFNFNPLPRNVTFQWEGNPVTLNSSKIPNIGEGVSLNVSVEDFNGAVVHYIYFFNVDSEPPDFILNGLFNGSIGKFNSIINVEVIDNSNQSGMVYWTWNNTNQSILIQNSQIIIPSVIGNATLYLFIKDQSDNWLNTSLEVRISLFIDLFLLNTITGTFLSDVDVLFKSEDKEFLMNRTGLGNYFLPITNGNHSLIIMKDNYNLTHPVVIYENNINLKFKLQNLKINTFDSKSNKPIQAFLQWNSSSFMSSMLNFNGTGYVLGETGDLSLYAFTESFSISRQITNSNNDEIYLPLGNVNLSIKIISEDTFKPIPEVLISLNNNIFGITNQFGILNVDITPGFHTLKIMASKIEKEINLTVYQSLQVIIPINVTSLITILIVDSSFLSLQNIEINIYDSSELLVENGVSDWDGEFITNSLSYGNYKIEINYQNQNYQKNIILNQQDPNPIVVVISTHENTYFAEIGVQAGKWIHNRQYQISDANSLSENTLNNLGFNIALIALFLIISLMTMAGVIATTSHPLYTLRKSIKNYQLIGATKFQIQISISSQLASFSSLSSAIGTFLGLAFMSTFPFFQVITIAGLMINPVTDLFILPFIATTFFLITFLAVLFSLRNI